MLVANIYSFKTLAHDEYNGISFKQIPDISIVEGEFILSPTPLTTPSPSPTIPPTETPTPPTTCS